jgi:hypothetical protein
LSKIHSSADFPFQSLRRRHRFGGKVRGSARRADIVADERPDRRLELLETRETAFEQVARRVGAGWEIAGGREK